MISNKYSDLYEPLIRIFEAGFSVGFRHGEFMVGTYSLGKIDIQNERMNDVFNIN